MLGLFLGLPCAGSLDPEGISVIAEAWLMSRIQPKAYSMLLQLPGGAELSEGQLGGLLHKALQYGQRCVYGVLAKHPQAPLHEALLQLHLECVPL
jgi:hypothetical protein